jgi:hypothetical protein
MHETCQWPLKGHLGYKLPNHPTTRSTVQAAHNPTEQLQ